MSDEELEKEAEAFASKRDDWVKPSWTKGDIEMAYFSGVKAERERIYKELRSKAIESAHDYYVSMQNIKRVCKQDDNDS